jgi:RNA polymerase sigma factor (TIGR02999 family)
MAEEVADQLSEFLRLAASGDETARSRLFEKVHDELRILAHRALRKEPSDHSWQTTDLVNEVAIKLLKSNALEKADRAYFFATVARAMRQLLVDHARAKRARKRPQQKIALDDIIQSLQEEQRIDLVALEDALAELETLDPRMHSVVILRYFAGQTENEIADQLGISRRTVQKDWQFARVWLRKKMEEGTTDGC